MSHIRHARRAATALITLAGSLLGLVFCAPSAFALIVRPVGAGSSSTVSPQSGATAAHRALTGGMAGWEIALIAVGAVLFVAAVAVLAVRARSSHRQLRVSAA